MFTVMLVMVIGILTGWMFRGRKLPFLSKVINVLIWVLLFLLGVEVGGDETIVNGMASIGLEGICIAIAGVTGSALFAWGLWLWSRNKEK